LAKVRPHLHTFISYLTIKELLGQSNAPAQTFVNTLPNLDLQKIQDSLLQLSKAVEASKKAPSSPPSNKDTNMSKSKQKLSAPYKPPTCTFSAIARARPPNPSLLVDLVNLGIGKEGQVKLEILCYALNKELATITPPQVQLPLLALVFNHGKTVPGGGCSSRSPHQPPICLSLYSSFC